MTIEIAERLCAYRKSQGFSQEELAERIGVSRQAVSKWERAEASPDTDNLILLAKIYGVTLDELLNVTPDATEASADVSGHQEAAPEAAEEEVEDKPVVSGWLRGWNMVPWPIICLIAYLLMGSLNVLGGWGMGWLIFLTIPLYYTLGTAIRNRNAEEFAYPVLTALVYLILGFSKGWWHPGWVVFLTIPVYYCICEAFQVKRK